jgi:hypothetical protein
LKDKHQKRLTISLKTAEEPMNMKFLAWVSVTGFAKVLEHSAPVNIPHMHRIFAADK